MVKRQQRRPPAQLTASAHQHDRDDGEHDAEGQRLVRLDRAARDRPAAGAAIIASMSASYHMLIAPEAPAPTAMQSTATAPSTGWRWPGATDKPGEAR